MRTSIVVAAMSAILATSPALAGFGESQADRDKRWSAIEQALFERNAIKRDDAAVHIEAPDRALDAAIVPLGITLAHPADVAAVYLVIDENPSPLAAHFVFGPDSDPREIKLRVRVNSYTEIHAVAEMKDGTRLMTAGFIKASGGCSAPMGVTDEEALLGIGDIKLKVGGDLATGQSVEARLMIRHPNFNGMQMNDVTHDYTPARFIQAMDVSYAGRSVFTLSSDISLASNPVITFDLKPHVDKGPLTVTVSDSQGEHWTKAFDLPQVAN